MAYTVTITDNAFPKDHEFGIRGLGVFVNGKPKEIDEDAERAYITETRSTLKDSLSDSEYVTLEGTTEVKGGLSAVLGINVAEISDTVDPEVMKMQEETGTVDPETGEPLDEPIGIVVDPPKSGDNK